jgi:Xaa-Pro aminopeptidase
MQQIFTNRVKKVLKKLRCEPTASCLVVTSNPTARRSHDTEYPYRQNSDLFYLTGSLRQDITLVLRPGNEPQVTLITPPEDKIKNLWEGPPPAIKPVVEALDAQLIRSKDPVDTTLNMLHGYESVFLPTNGSQVSIALRQHLSLLPNHQKRGLPQHIADTETLTSAVRCIKSSNEIKQIRRSCALTSAVLYHISETIYPGITEYELAALIDYLYRLHGAEPSFNTIVASGKSAATLHYTPSHKPLRDGELVLIDSGCELDMYASDITRTIPVGDSISPALRDVYEIVLASQQAAIRKVKPGATMHAVYSAAVKELTLGLKDLGILKGPTEKLIREAAYQPWFPHGIGHSLGIDVHDPTPFPTNRDFILEPGMVITVEPGLYFARKKGQIPASGIRIEDDILVTKQGHEILSEDVFPTALEEVALLRGETSD